MADELTDELAGPRQLKEPGSPAWCVQTVRYLKSHVRHVDEQWRQAEQVLEELAKFKAWRVIPPDSPYGTLNKMLKAEVGLDEKAIKGAIRNAELATRGGDRKSDQVDNSNLIGAMGGGTSSAYTIRRLRRDRPDLAERVERGELSANKAAIQAGFRERMVSIPASHPERMAAWLRKNMPEAIPRLIELLTREGE